MAELVSVITPTGNRSKFLPKLYYCFCQQEYEKKELLVLDDSPEPDAKFIALTKDDSRVKYFHQYNHILIGTKRNRLVEAASGTIIAHFDDDDYYAPNYLSRMVNALGQSDFVHLSCAYNYGELSQTVGYYSMLIDFSAAYTFSPGQKEVTKRMIHKNHHNIWGHGFSYFYRRDMALKHPFLDVDLGEDTEFARTCKANGYTMFSVADPSICLHIVHMTNTSYISVQEIYGPEKLVELFGDNFKRYQSTTYADTEPVRQLTSEPIRRIGLCMVVHDEEFVIARALESAKPLIDYWLICDTGSTDRTKDIIRETMVGIPGELHDRVSTNFRDNHNEALALLRGKAQYALLLNADDVLVVPPDYKLPSLDQDGYRIEVVVDGTHHYRLHLIRTDLDYRYESEIHDILFSPPPKKEAVLSGIRYECLQDGMRVSLANHFANDTKTLETLRAKNPTNARYVFYLAQSWQANGERQKAIDVYRELLRMQPDRPYGIWASEEAYYALLQIAKLLEQMEASEATVMEAYLQAYESQPIRAEPLYYLCFYLRRKQRYRAAAGFAMLGADLPLPKSTFHVETDIYEWRMKDEHATALTWLLRDAEVIAIYDTLLRSGKLPESEHGRVLAVMRNCYQNVGQAR